MREGIIMERLQSLLRLIGIFFIPASILLLAAIIWQNSSVMVGKFLLVGKWWYLEEVRLSSLLFCFTLLGAFVLICFGLLIASERKLNRKLDELYQIKKHGGKVKNGEVQNKAESPVESTGHRYKYARKQKDNKGKQPEDNPGGKL